MKFKGHTKIALFDAKTGAMTDCVESDNIVTNFFDAIFNNNLQRFVRVSGTDWEFPKSLFGLDGIVKDLMSGVMVFSEEIPEDADHIYPTLEEARTMIGCGNQGSSITGSTFKGQINAQETEITDTYATFVWDFTTAQCNGDIACICLTSNRGGHLGCRFDAKDSDVNSKVSMLSPYGGYMWGPLETSPSLPSNFHNLSGSLCQLFGGDSNYGMFVESDTEFRYRRYTSLYVWKKPRCITGDLSFGLRDGTKIIRLDAETYTVDDTVSGDVNCLSKGVAVKIERGSVNGANVINVYKYGSDLTTPPAISVPYTNMETSIKEFISKTGSLNTDSFRYFYKDKFILIYGAINRSESPINNKLRCYLLSLDGQFVYHDTEFSSNLVTTLFGTASINETYMSTNVNDFGYLVVIDDELFIVLKWNVNGRSLLHINMETAEIDPTPMYSFTDSAVGGLIFESDDGIVTKPFYSVTPVGLLSGQNPKMKGITFMPNYLATINNQPTILTKTPDKTMKIVYTLTQTD